MEQSTRSYRTIHKYNKESCKRRRFSQHIQLLKSNNWAAGGSGSRTGEKIGSSTSCTVTSISRPAGGSDRRRR
nr:unnamed protein product [Callosobruchus analis]